MAPTMKILFICKGNRMRSVVAEAFYRKLGGEADSAGTKPAHRISRRVQEYLKTEGVLQFCKEKPEGLEGKNLDDYDLIVILDKNICRKEFESYHEKLYLQHFPDPWWRPIRARKIYQNIEKLVNLLSALNYDDFSVPNA